MERQSNSLPQTAETNGKPFYHQFQTGEGGIEEEKWDLGWLAAVVRRRALLMGQVALGIFLIAGGGLLLAAKTAPPNYEGKFQLLVEPITAEEQQARSSARAQGSPIRDAEQINIEQSSLDYESQIRILEGPKLLDPIVNQVRQRYPEVTYETLIKNLTIERISVLTKDKKEQGTKLIDVNYQDKNPEKIKFVLEQLSQAYLNYSLKERQSTIRRGINFIDSQLPPLRQRVDFLQGEIQALRQKYNIVDPELQGKQLTENASRLEQTKADSQTQLAEALAKRSALAQQLQNANPQSVLGETIYYQTLLTQYQQVESQLAVEAARLKTDNPAMQSLLEKRRNLQNLLNQEASRVVSKAGDAITIAEARHRAILQSEIIVNQKIQQLPTIARQYADLQRELTIATDSLNKFATRQEALQIDAAQQEIPWELTIPPKLLLDESGNLAKVSKFSKLRMLALIAILAILLGVGAGFLVEVSQDQLHTSDETKEITRLPLLGIVPHNKLSDDETPSMFGLGFSTFRDRFFSDKTNRTEISTLHYDHSQLLPIPSIESFRSLYKNIRLLSNNNGQIRSLAVTSAEAGDGKSTIALHLALTAAALGQRILLVDADLRHPQIHERLGLTNYEGLSDLLSEDRDLRQVLQSHPIHKNLTVLTAGQLVDDPVAILTSHRIEPLFLKLKAMFDLILLDTPPLVGLADCGLIASQSDSLALIIRLGKTKRQSVLTALEDIKFSSTVMLGVIANDAHDTVSLPSTYHVLTQQS
jgi:capsular exopolysaccharide synthesis family protein